MMSPSESFSDRKTHDETTSVGISRSSRNSQSRSRSWVNSSSPSFSGRSSLFSSCSHYFERITTYYVGIQARDNFRDSLFEPTLHWGRGNDPNGAEVRFGSS